MPTAIQFTLNGKPAEIDTDPRRPLLWVLRTELGLTGTKYGCGERECGACMVLLDGRPIYSCRTPVRSAQGREITTIEGLEEDGALHPVQKAFAEHDALQCGFCTPGMIMGAVGLLLRNPDPSADEIRAGLEGHICRCGTYKRVIDAVQDAARAQKEAQS
ncbi:MAG: (2Fe-2S)-binding protein [Gemmatimonadota bacterium]|jgi:aerobic-type carbon monoxide dehydrogenase small subunit (CoxS/CutS family)